MLLFSSVKVSLFYIENSIYKNIILPIWAVDDLALVVFGAVVSLGSGFLPLSILIL